MAGDDQGPVKRKEGVKEATSKITNDGVKSTLQPLGKKRARPGHGDVKSEATNTSPKPAKRVHAEEVIAIEDDEQQQEKEEETSEEPTAPWICDIYRRDIVQFLTREEIEEMRVTLPSWMLPVMATPKMLPRRVYDRLEVMNATGNDYRVNEQGYIWFGSSDYEWDDWNGGGSDWRIKLAGDPFHEVLEFSRCCKDEKAKTAEALAGQLLYPKLGEKTPVGLRLGLMPRMPVHPYLQRTVVWGAANKLTRDTAAGLLHFLYHLDGCCVRELLVQTDPLVNNNNNHDGDATDGEEQEGVLNPRMFEVYREVYGNGKALRLYAKQVAEWGDGAGLDRWLGGGAAGANPNLLRTTNLVTMKTARQLCAGGKAIRPFSGVSIRFDNGQAVVDLISSLRPYCNKMMVHTWGRTAVDMLDGINHIVNHFKHEFGGSLATLIPQVEFTIYGSGDGGGALYGVPLRNGLPASCPKGEATTQTHEQARAGYRRGGGGLTRFTYKFRFETPAAGEHFHVKIHTVRLRQRAAQRGAGANEQMCRMELCFDNSASTRDDTSTWVEGLMDADIDY